MNQTVGTYKHTFILTVEAELLIPLIVARADLWLAAIASADYESGLPWNIPLIVEVIEMAMHDL